MNTSGQRIRGDGGMWQEVGEVSVVPMERGCGEAEDEQPGASIINVPHEECQLPHPRPTFTHFDLKSPSLEVH